MTDETNKQEFRDGDILITADGAMRWEAGGWVVVQDDKQRVERVREALTDMERRRDSLYAMAGTAAQARHIHTESRLEHKAAGLQMAIDLLKGALG